MNATPKIRIFAVNFVRVDVNELSMWFSYETMIAFQAPETGLVVHQNDWSTTTGKHLNEIDGGDYQAKNARLSGSEFAKKFQEIQANY